MYYMSESTPHCVVTFYTEKGELVLRGATISDTGSIDGDVIAISTYRDMGADAPTFSMKLTAKSPWHRYIGANDLVTVEMARPPEKPQIIFVGLVEESRKHIATSEDSVERYISVTGRGVAKSVIQFDVGIVPEAEVSTETVGWLVANGVMLSGSTCKDIITAIWEKILIPYVDYKWANNKNLFNMINYTIKNRDDMVLLDDSSLINWQGNVWSLFKEIAESPFYESYWEIQDDVPTFIVRPTPFNKSEWNSLPSIDLLDIDVNVEDVGRSDLETYTVFSVGAKTMYSSNDAYKTFGSRPLWYEPYADKYGIRRLHVYSAYIYATGDTEVKSNADLMKTLQTDLYNWNIKNNSMFNGTFNVKGSNKYKVGYRLSHTSDDDGITTEYYIRSVAQQYLFGSWSTELGVVRGMIATDRFAYPVTPTPKEYTGIGFAMSTGTSSAPVASPADSSKANAVVNGAIAEMNTHRIKYVFGANMPELGQLDCSSFTQYVFKKYGDIDIGRTTGDQVTKGVEIPNIQDLVKGDLVLFKDTYDSGQLRGASHVGIYIGNYQFVHNSSGARTVITSSLNEAYYKGHWLTGRRIFSTTTWASRIDKVLGGVLAGHGNTFMYYADKYGMLDPVIIPAIAMHETGNGTSKAVRTQNNVGGIMNPDGMNLRTFASLDAGIEYMTRLIKSNYIDMGLDTIEEIQKKYCPVGASNDPTGLNKYWVSGVTKFYNMISNA